MRLSLLLVTIVLIAGCGGGDSQDEVAAEAAESTSEVTASVVDGVQVVEIEAGERGFSPDRVHLTSGVPARLIFIRTTEADCLVHISVPEYGVERKPLPMHEEIAIEFTPEEAGEFTFVCGMGMQSGTLVVSV